MKNSGAIAKKNDLPGNFTTTASIQTQIFKIKITCASTFTKGNGHVSFFSSTPSWRALHLLCIISETDQSGRSSALKMSSILPTLSNGSHVKHIRNHSWWQTSHSSQDKLTRVLQLQDRFTATSLLSLFMLFCLYRASIDKRIYRMKLGSVSLSFS